MKHPWIVAIVICVIAAVLEGLLSGKDPKQRFKELRLPRYSPPFWAWILIGAFYYVMCFAVLYRIFASPVTHYKLIPLLTLLSLMLINAAWNWVFFRARNLFISCIAFFPYGILALVLFVSLLRFDPISAWFVLPYLIYLIYANFWGYKLWKLNRDTSNGNSSSSMERRL